MWRVIAVLMLVAGCSTMQPADQSAQVVRGATVLGSVGCAILAGELKPVELAQARVANAAALAVLSDAPSLTALRAAMEASPLPPRYALLAAILIQQVREQYGDALPVDSDGWRAASGFLSSCGLALG